MTSADSQSGHTHVAHSPDKIRTWQPSNGIVFGSAVDHPSARRCKQTFQISPDKCDNETIKSINNPSTVQGHTTPSSGKSSPRNRLRNNVLEPTRPRPRLATLGPQQNDLSRAFSNLAIDSPNTNLFQPKPMLYWMADDTYTKAQDRSQFWEYEFYKNQDGQKPKLHYCRKLDQSEEVARLFLDEDVIGFDIEWSPRTFYRSLKAREQTHSIKDNVSVIQIASQSRIAIFQLAMHYGSTVEELLAPSLRHIMESSAIVKAGVNINNDCTRIEKFLGTQVRSRAELSHMHNLARHYHSDPSKINRKTVALQILVQEHLGLPLCKDDVRTSHWERALDQNQLKYAASDAYAGLQLYHVLAEKCSALHADQPLPAFAELKQPIRVVTNAGEYNSEDEAETPSVTTEHEKRLDE